MKDNKKTLVLSIIGILVLVIAVVGVSFAMFSFSGTGKKENVITTGTVSLDFDTVSGGTSTNVISVDNKYPVNDADGIDISEIDSKADFSVKATYSANMTINYELGITDINSDIDSDATEISSDYVKILLIDSEGNAIIGTKSNDKYTGVSISELANKSGAILSNYFLTSGTFTSINKTASYKIVAYLDSSYKLPVDTDNSTTDNEGNVTRGTTSTKTTKTAQFSFKLNVSAAQA